MSPLPNNARISRADFSLFIAGGDPPSGTYPGSVDETVSLEIRNLTESINESTTMGFDSTYSRGSFYAVASGNPRSSDAGDRYEFNEAMQFLAEVQGAADANGTADFMLKLPDYLESQAQTRLFYFRSDESTNYAQRPMLTVEYTIIPEPASAGLALGAAATCLVRRPRRRLGERPRPA